MEFYIGSTQQQVKGLSEQTGKLLSSPETVQENGIETSCIYVAM